MPHNTVDLQIFKQSSCPVPILKTTKIRQSRIGNWMVCFFQTYQIWSCALQDEGKEPWLADSAVVEEVV
jgi:hypothetical protein